MLYHYVFQIGNPSFFLLLCVPIYIHTRRKNRNLIANNLSDGKKKRTLRPHKGRTHILLPAPATSSHYFHKYHKKKDDLFGKGEKMLYLCAI